VFDIITSILASLGGFGVFLLMLAENVFPSEVLPDKGAARCDCRLHCCAAIAWALWPSDG
jgi:hypothetical protein